jgi:hypothetical protein
MFEFHLERMSDASDPDRPEPLVIATSKLYGATFSSLPAFLLEILPVRFDLDGSDTHLGARPIQFDMGGLRLSERAIWCLLVQLPGAADHVSAYISNLLARPRDRDILDFCTSLDVVGQDPLYAYLDHCVRPYNLTLQGELSDHLQVIESFIAFLRHCDLDHETFQDEYIQMVLSFLYWHDRSPRIHRGLRDLLHLRLTTGQYTQPMPEYSRYLSSKGLLREIVDMLIATESGKSLRVDVLTLCAVVYGSDTSCRDAVLAYCRNRTELDEAKDLSYFAAELAFLAEQRDAWLKRYAVELDTGFHVRHKGSGEWSWVVRNK